MIISIYSFFILIQILNIYQSYIVIKFKRYNPINKELNNKIIGEFITQRITNTYRSMIYLGDPPQAIPGFLKTNQYSFILTNYECPHAIYYFEKKSKTFSNSNQKDYNYYKFFDSLSFYSSLDSEKYDIIIKNYTILAENELRGPQCFHIGTQLLINQEEKDKNLMDGLHKQKIIKSYYYEYQINNENEMNLILGLEEDFENNNNYKFIKPIIVPYTSQINMKWGLIFQKMYLNDYNVSYSKEVKSELDINCGCILGNSDFKEYFKNYLNENGIKIEPIRYEKDYYIYFFEKNMTGIDKIKNINLVFYHKELNYNFNFNYEDLFLESNNGYYFLIAFEYDFRSSWKFGFPFFKKYKFIFNHDSKLMGFYCPNGCPTNENDDINNGKYNYDNKDKDSKTIEDKTNQDKKNNSLVNDINNNNQNSRQFAFFIILIIFLGIIIIVIAILLFGIFIGKKMFGVRKNKVNELLELYDYSAGEKEKNKEKSKKES